MVDEFSRQTRKQTKKPTWLVGSGWVLRYSNLKAACYDSLIRVPTLLQQQQQGLEFVFGVIVMANLLYRC